VALAKAIETLASDPALRARLGAAARKTALARFTRERFKREIGEAQRRSLDTASRHG
jgi:glycosyltransferase involved in cell wall biosynthesis